MELDVLKIDYEEWREVARKYPREIEVIMAMLVGAEVDICQEVAA